MTDVSQTLIDFLTRQYLFQGLSLEQIRRIAEGFEQKQFTPNQVVVKQGDLGDEFYIVLEGRATVSYHKSGSRKEISLGTVRSGDYFGEEAVLNKKTRSATITAIEDLILLCLNEEKLRALLAEHPQIGNNLQAAAAGRKFSRRLKIDWLGEDEVVYLIFRKHPYFLWLWWLAPMVLLIAALLTGTYGWLLGPAGTNFQVIGVAAAIIAVLWAIWDWVDWGNDYYILTSRRVIRLDKVILLYDSRNEAPLDAVISSEVNSSWLGRILNFGNVDVQTFTGRISMDRMTSPYQFASFVDAHKNWAVLQSREQEVQKMAQDLESALRERSLGDSLSIKKPRPITMPPPPPKKPSEWSERLETLLKVRYERGGTITYRKHWLILLSKTWQPLLANFVAWMIIGTALWMHYLESFTFVPLTVVCTLGPLALIGLGLWLLYHYVDWSNDRYIISSTQIIDIEKKPLGTENKKSANLDSQDFRVEHTRDNLINIIFDFGNVVVRIGQTQFTFDWVHHPDKVHQDVVRAREALMQRKRQEESARDRKRMIEWLVMYHEQAEKVQNPATLPPKPEENSG